MLYDILYNIYTPPLLLLLLLLLLLDRHHRHSHLQRKFSYQVEVARVGFTGRPRGNGRARATAAVVQGQGVQWLVFHAARDGLSVRLLLERRVRQKLRLLCRCGGGGGTFN